MSNCMEGDLAVALARASDDPGRLLEHVIDCADCMAMLRVAVDARRSLRGEGEPRAGFVQEVMAALPAASVRPATTRVPSLGSVGWGLALGVLAAAAVVMVAAVTGAGLPVERPPIPVLLAALAAGVAFAARFDATGHA